MQDYEGFTAEERVTQCACGNLLRITVYLRKADLYSFWDHNRVEKAGSVAMIQAVDEESGRGCCISHRWKRSQWGHPGKRIYAYGPTNVMSGIRFVFCKACRGRVAWKKFKKVNL